MQWKIMLANYSTPFQFVFQKKDYTFFSISFYFRSLKNFLLQRERERESKKKREGEKVSSALPLSSASSRRSSVHNHSTPPQLASILIFSTFRIACESLTKVLGLGWWWWWCKKDWDKDGNKNSRHFPEENSFLLFLLV